MSSLRALTLGGQFPPLLRGQFSRFFQQGVKIKGSHIMLEGAVTANQNFKILADGSIETKNGKFTGQIISNVGYIGGFQIAAGRIGEQASPSGESGGSLAIYNNFFRVGGGNGYAMLGNNVMPGSWGGYYTAAGRIVNKHPNNDIYVGGSNYGLYINVSGGKKNYGVWSNAPLCASAFINTQVKELALSGSNYQIDFSQHSVFLMKASSYAAITLPDKSSVESMFEVSPLPRDFGALVLFKVRSGSQNIILNNVYNQNEDTVNLEMASGDSAWVLISNMDGFRYNLLSSFK